MSQIRKTYRDVKKGIYKQRIAESFWATRYKFSPYAACEHGCLYCDGRAEKYHIEGEFDRDIVIRKNLPEVLERELPKLREKGTISCGSGVSDAYQPVEAEERLTRACAEVILKHKFPVALSTKSNLILNDLDIWTQIAKQCGFIFMTSLMTTDDSIRQEFEPRGSSVEERFEMMKVMKKAGASVGLMAMPMLPGISDSEKAAKDLFQKALDCGVDFIYPGGLTLRPGRQKDIYFTQIGSKHPELKDLYRKTYAECRQSGNTTYAYRKKFYAIIYKLIVEMKICFEIPHRIYKPLLTKADEVFILLSHMLHIYDYAGINIKALEKSYKNYTSWLDEQRAVFNRKRSLASDWVDENLLFITQSGELETILQNNKLFSFLTEVILNNKTFDYISRKLEPA